MTVYDPPRTWRRSIDFLRSVAVNHTLVVSHAEESRLLQDRKFFLIELFTIDGLLLRGGRVEVALPVRWSYAPVHLSRRYFGGLAPKHPVVVHRHQSKENVSVSG